MSIFGVDVVGADIVRCDAPLRSWLPRDQNGASVNGTPFIRGGSSKMLEGEH